MTVGGNLPVVDLIRTENLSTKAQSVRNRAICQRSVFLLDSQALQCTHTHVFYSATTVASDFSYLENGS